MTTTAPRSTRISLCLFCFIYPMLAATQLPSHIYFSIPETNGSLYIFSIHEATDSLFVVKEINSCEIEKCVAIDNNSLIELKPLAETIGPDFVKFDHGYDKSDEDLRLVRYALANKKEKEVVKINVLRVCKLEPSTKKNSERQDGTIDFYPPLNWFLPKNEKLKDSIPQLTFSIILPKKDLVAFDARAAISFYTVDDKDLAQVNIFQPDRLNSFKITYERRVKSLPTSEGYSQQFAEIAEKNKLDSLRIELKKKDFPKNRTSANLHLRQGVNTVILPPGIRPVYDDETDFPNGVEYKNGQIWLYYISKGNETVSIKIQPDNTQSGNGE